jgi:hypothetical protein
VRESIFESKFSESRRLANINAARIGPTVCELDGPIPIEKSSNVLIAISIFRPVGVS